MPRQMTSISTKMTELSARKPDPLCMVCLRSTSWATKALCVRKPLLGRSSDSGHPWLVCVLLICPFYPSDGLWRCQDYGLLIMDSLSTFGFQKSLINLNVVIMYFLTANLLSTLSIYIHTFTHTCICACKDTHMFFLLLLTFASCRTNPSMQKMCGNYSLLGLGGPGVLQRGNLFTPLLLDNGSRASSENLP